MTYFYFLLAVMLSMRKFSKKLLFLLHLELLGLLMILILAVMFHTNNRMVVSYVFFSVFMVLDSVLGLTLLVSSSRNSSYFSTFFKSF